MTRIAIVGGGAMGSVYAALLGDAGNEVTVVDVWREHVEAIERDGLRLEGASGDRTVRIHATTDAATVAPVDLVVIATKAMHVEAASESAKALLGPDTVVLPIQNGLGSVDRAAAILGEERTVTGVVGGFGASIVGPGHAHHNGMELVRLGERGARGVTERIERVADVWRGAGFTVRCFEDIDQLVWEKLICNVAFSAPCAILERTIGEALEDPDAWAVSRACAREAYAVARARGIALSFDDPAAYVRDFGRKIPDARPSMLLDLLAGRACEIDVINGAIPREGAIVGVPTPVNETVVSLVKARQSAILAATS